MADRKIIWEGPMYRAATLGAALLALSLGTTSAMAQDETQEPQQPQQPPCSTEEYRQLDFWVGEWDARWVDGEGAEKTGSNHITLEQGGCMIEENFNGNPGVPFTGHSISMYVGYLGEWKQVWMDSAGGFLDFTGGPDEGGFHFTLVPPTEETPGMRMIFRNIAEDSFDWHWQRWDDEGEAWGDQWVIHYTRAE